MEVDQKYPPAVAVAISKLINTIKEKNDCKELNSLELKYIKEQCCYGDPFISQVAIKALISLVNDGILDGKSCLTDFITILTTTNCTTNMAYLINNLLLLDKQLEEEDYECTYNLRLPQHPLIVMLNKNPNYWTSIINEIKYTYYTCEKNGLQYNNLYRPLYFYVICCPDENYLTQFKQELWEFLVMLKNSKRLLEELLSWLPLNQPQNSKLLITLHYASIDDGKSLISTELVILWCISMLENIFLNNSESRFLIGNIQKCLGNLKNLMFANCSLLMLANALRKCNPIYLEQLLSICRTIIVKKNNHPVVLQVLKASLLQWIANPSILTTQAVRESKEIFYLIDHNTENSPSKIKGNSEKIKELIQSNRHVYNSIKLCVLLESWKNENDIIEWIGNLDDCTNYFILEISHFLYGLFLMVHPQIQIKLLDFLLNCSKEYKWMKNEILTLILFVLSNSIDSGLHFKLLKSLPQLANNRDNLQKIMATIQALSSGTGYLKTFASILLFDLWKVEVKCYPYLEKTLVEEFNPEIHKSEWEFFIQRANILKTLCMEKPELYGKQMVAHLSKILNDTNDIELANAFAIDGISSLCKCEIIDAITTWAALSPMIKLEKRPIVVKSICNFIKEISSLSYLDAYPKLVEDVMGKLWDYIALANPEILPMALDALAAFDLEQISAHFPEQYLEELGENWLKGAPIPGKIWISFMDKMGYVKIVGDFLIKMVAKEISTYLKFVYQVKGSREPANYSYLPSTSIVRALGHYIQIGTSKDVKKPILLECLRILSQEYSKPLPPLDWCFLQEFFHKKDTKYYCMNIASHQVVISGTARRFIENLLIALTDEDHSNINDVLNIYENLKFLANSIQPVTLKPFLEVTITNALNSFQKNSEEDFLLEILKHLEIIFKKPEIQEINKSVIAGVLIEEMGKADFSSKIFDVFLEIVPYFPTNIVKELTSPKFITEINPSWYRKAIKIRTKMALNVQNSPLDWLNEIIEIGPYTDQDLVLNEFQKAFKKHKNNTDSVLWLLELIGQIQALINDKFELKKLIFFCDIFIVAVITFSGHFLFERKKNIDLFPQAFASLLDINHWSICTTQVLEWLYYMVCEPTIPLKYRQIFCHCLQALRHDDEFKKNQKWTKYLGCTVTT